MKKGNPNNSIPTSNPPVTNSESVDLGFRKIVKRLFIIVAITMVTVGAYLYFNFTSPSNLPVIVPADATFFVQFQTRKIRDEVKSPPQAELDSLVRTVASLPALNWVANPADVGIALFSDVVYFQHPKYQALAVSLNSEPRFMAFLDSLKTKGFVSGLVQKEKYAYTEIMAAGWDNVFIAFKHKAAVIIQWKSQTALQAKSIKELFAGENHPPKNMKSDSKSTKATNASLKTDQLEVVLAKIFTGDGNGFVKNTEIQKLYDEQALVLMTNGKSNSDGWKMTGKDQMESLKSALKFATSKLKYINQNGL